MKFAELIKALKEAKLTDSPTKPGTAKECIDAILDADLSHPVRYCNTIRANLQKMIEAGVTGKIGSYSVGELYDDLEPRKVSRLRFVETIPGYRSFAQYDLRKQQAKAKVMEILSDPQRVNTALIDRDAVRMPADSPYAQPRNALGFLYDPAYRPESGFVRTNATRVAGFFEQAFTENEVNLYGYTVDKIKKSDKQIQKGEIRELREALVLEAALFAVQSDYSKEDQDDIMSLNGYVFDDIITNDQFEQISSAMKARQQTISVDKVLAGSLSELVPVMRVTLLVHVYARKLEQALLDPLTVNQFLLDGQTIRESSVAYPFAYLMTHPDLLENLQTVPEMNLLHIPEPHPLRTVDLRGQADLMAKLPDEASRQYFNRLPKYQKIYLHGVMRQIENELYQKYDAKIGQLTEKLSQMLGDLSAEQKQEVIRCEQEIAALNARRGMVMRGVMQTLTEEKMTAILQSAFKPHYVNFMRHLSELDLTSADNREMQEYKQLALKTLTDAAHQLTQRKYSDVQQEAAEFANLNEMCAGFIKNINENTARTAKKTEDFLTLDDQAPDEWSSQNSNLADSSEDADASEELAGPDIDTSVHVNLDTDAAHMRLNESMASVQVGGEEEDKGKDDALPLKFNDQDDNLDLMIQLGREAMSAAKKNPAPVKSVLDTELDEESFASAIDDESRPLMVEHDPVHDVLPESVLRENFGKIVIALMSKNNEAALAALYELSRNISKLKSFMNHVNVADANAFFKQHYPQLTIRREYAEQIKVHGAVLQDAISSLMQAYAGVDERAMVTELQQPNSAFMVFAAVANVDFTDAEYADKDAISLSNDVVQPYCKEMLKVNSLDRECAEYMRHLGRALFDEMIKDADPGVFELCKKLISFSNDGVKRFLNVEKLLNPDPVDQKTVRILQAKNPSFDLALQKFSSIKLMKHQLERGDLSPANRLENFKELFTQNRALLETRRDSAAKKFLRAVVNLFSFGLAQKRGFWRVEGEKTAKKMDDILEPKSSRKPN